ncbi:universal stress protein [Desulfocurvus sp.]|jgi:nucleotide-binding universal stress UspA family protein|uniref:universal stress protein n=1 Tax=Desulfocurvus sp. TaxID=2871698 RepID=UPI0025B7BB31|nr:universal stress protein [Desulfocurvus sp.]MCK9240341.1 universal stress protein [Desulfocurvus sp.]
MKDIKKILCAVDFSEATARVADWAAYLGRTLGAEVLLLYVVPDMGRYSDFQVSAGYITGFEREIMNGARLNMEDCLDTLEGQNVQGLVVMGDPAREILSAVTEHRANLVVIGTHGRKGLDRIIFGSVADQVVKTSPVPVITVRPYDRA